MVKPTPTTMLDDWIGINLETGQIVEQGILNEPCGIWPLLNEKGELSGLFIADTGNDCVRFASPNGQLTTPKF